MGQAGAVTAAVSYLRLLAALVMRAPSPDEATARARLLIVALVTAITTEACAIVDGGAGVRVRSMASDSVVLSMQTLRFLLGWAEQSAGTSSGDASRGSIRGSHRGVQSPFATASAAQLGGGVGEGARGGEAPICLHGLRARLSFDESKMAAATRGGGSGGGDNPASSSSPCFVCPLMSTARRCDFNQVAQSVSDRKREKQSVNIY